MKEDPRGSRSTDTIAATNAHGNLTVSVGQMAKSLEKLPSGFRNNRADDDASRISISEGMRSQIGGLKLGVRNARDCAGNLGQHFSSG